MLVRTRTATRLAIVATVVMTVAVALLASPRAAGAAPVPVSHVADDGQPGSLRSAIGALGAPGLPMEVLAIPAGTYSLTDCSATGGDLDITSDHTIMLVADGGPVTIRQTCAGQRVLEQFGTGGLALVGMTINNGSVVGAGGGLRVDGSILLVGSQVRGNSATTGGGVSSQTGVYALSSTLAHNIATGAGGGIAAPAVIAINLTMDNNGAKTGGGAIKADNAAIARSTITRSRSTDSLTIGHLALQATVLAETTTGQECGAGTVVSSVAYNATDDASCGLAGATDIVTTTPLQLGFLTAGPVGVRRPAGTSVLVNVIPPTAGACVGNDATGVALPQGTNCDIGAAEVAGPGAATGPVADIAVRAGAARIFNELEQFGSTLYFAVDNVGTTTVPASEAQPITVHIALAAGVSLTPDPAVPCVLVTGGANCQITFPLDVGSGTAEYELAMSASGTPPAQAAAVSATSTAFTDPQPADNATTVTSADVGVTAQRNVGPVGPGGQVPVTFTLTNHGAGTARGLRAVAVFESVALTLSASAGEAAYNGASLTWTLPTLAAGATATLTVNVNPAPSGSFPVTMDLRHQSFDVADANDHARVDLGTTPA